MLATLSVSPHKSREIKTLADWGFEFVMGNTVFPSMGWEKEIARVHSNGMKFIARWPNIWHLGLEDKRYAFQSYDCQYNLGNGRIDGPSHWNMAAEQIVVENLMPLVNMGIDGVLVSMLGSDRPFPTDWYAFPNTNGQLLYWSFDEEAQKQWGERSGGKRMPEIPHVIDGKCADEQLEFYRWYQNGWIAKLSRLSEAAINAGLKHIWTWLIPLADWTMENMADGTADCVGQIRAWRRGVIDAGANPLIVVACHFPLEQGYPHWFDDSERTILELCTAYYKGKGIYHFPTELIIGAETADARPNDIVPTLHKHSHEAADLGACGLCCGDTIALKNTQFYDDYKAAFLSAQQAFEKW